MAHPRPDRRLRAGGGGRHQLVRLALLGEPLAGGLAGGLLRGVPLRGRLRRRGARARAGGGGAGGDSRHRDTRDARGGAREPGRAGARGAGARAHHFHLAGSRRRAQRAAPAPRPPPGGVEPGRSARLGGVRPGQPPAAGRRDPRGDQRALQEPHRGGRGHLAGVHLRAGPRAAGSRQPPLRHPVDGPQGARHRLRHGRGVQRRHRAREPRGIDRGGPARDGPRAGAVRRRRRLRPRGPALAPLPLRRDHAEPHHVAHHADHLPAGGRLPSLHGPHAAGADAAFAGGAAQGLRLLGRRDRPALPQAGTPDLAHRCRSRRGDGDALRERHARPLRRVLLLPDVRQRPGRPGRGNRDGARRGRGGARRGAGGAAGGPACARRVDASRAAAALSRRPPRALGAAARAAAGRPDAGAQPRATAAAVLRQRLRHRHRRGAAGDAHGDGRRHRAADGMAVHHRATRGRAGPARGAARHVGHPLAASAARGRGGGALPAGVVALPCRTPHEARRALRAGRRADIAPGRGCRRQGAGRSRPRACCSRASSRRRSA